jgi:hypothetical protein
VLRRFKHSDGSECYTATFRGVSIPMSEYEIDELLKISEKKLNNLTSIKNEEVLRDL